MANDETDPGYRVRRVDDLAVGDEIILGHRRTAPVTEGARWTAGGLAVRVRLNMEGRSLPVTYPPGVLVMVTNVADRAARSEQSPTGGQQEDETEPERETVGPAEPETREPPE